MCRSVVAPCTSLHLCCSYLSYSILQQHIAKGFSCLNVIYVHWGLLWIPRAFYLGSDVPIVNVFLLKSCMITMVPRAVLILCGRKQFGLLTIFLLC